jgi:hypothetical protein
LLNGTILPTLIGPAGMPLQLAVDAPVELAGELGELTVVVEPVLDDLDDELHPAANSTTRRTELPAPTIPHLLRLRRSIWCFLLAVGDNGGNGATVKPPKDASPKATVPDSSAQKVPAELNRSQDKRAIFERNG